MCAVYQGQWKAVRHEHTVHFNNVGCLYWSDERKTKGRCGLSTVSPQIHARERTISRQGVEKAPAALQQCVSLQSGGG